MKKSVVLTSVLFLIMIFAVAAGASSVCNDEARAPEQVTSDFMITSLNKKLLELVDLENFLAQEKWTNPYRARRRSPEGNAAFHGFVRASQKLNVEQRERTKTLLRAALVNEKKKAGELASARGNTKWVLGHPIIEQEIEVPRLLTGRFMAPGDSRRSAHGWLDGRPIFVQTYVKTEKHSEYADILFDPFHPDPSQRIFEFNSGYGLKIHNFKIFEKDRHPLLVSLLDHSVYDLKDREYLQKNPFFVTKEVRKLKLKDAFQAGANIAFIGEDAVFTLINARGVRIRTSNGSLCVTYKFHTVGSRHFLSCLPSDKKTLHIFDLDSGEVFPEVESRAQSSTENKISFFEQDGEIFYTQFEFDQKWNLELFKVRLSNRDDRVVIAKPPLPSNAGVFLNSGEYHFFVEGNEKLVTGDFRGGPIYTAPAPGNVPFNGLFQYNGETFGFRKDDFNKFSIQSLDSGNVFPGYNFTGLVTNQYVFMYQGNLYGFFTRHDKSAVLLRLEQDTSLP